MVSIDYFLFVCMYTASHKKVQYIVTWLEKLKCTVAYVMCSILGYSTHIPSKG